MSIDSQFDLSSRKGCTFKLESGVTMTACGFIHTIIQGTNLGNMSVTQYTFTEMDSKENVILQHKALTATCTDIFALNMSYFVYQNVIIKM